MGVQRAMHESKQQQLNSAVRATRLCIPAPRPPAPQTSGKLHQHNMISPLPGSGG